MTSTLIRPTGFELTLTDVWEELPIAPARRDAYIRSSADAATTADGRRALAALRTSATTAWDHGTRLAALASLADDPSPLAAILTIGTYEIGTELPEAALEEVAERRRGTGRDAALVATDAGVALRRREKRKLRVEELGDIVEFAVFQYFIPTRTRADLAILTFATPSIDCADELAELFDAITATFRFVTDAGN